MGGCVAKKTVECVLWIGVNLEGVSYFSLISLISLIDWLLLWVPQSRTTTCFSTKNMLRQVECVRKMRNCSKVLMQVVYTMIFEGPDFSLISQTNETNQTNDTKIWNWCRVTIKQFPITIKGSYIGLYGFYGSLGSFLWRKHCPTVFAILGFANLSGISGPLLRG